MFQPEKFVSGWRPGVAPVIATLRKIVASFFCNAHGSASDDCDDVVQEALVRLLGALSAGKPITPDKLGAYLTVIAQNVARDVLRRRRREACLEDAPTDVLAEPPPDSDDKALKAIREWVDRLPAELRSVYLLRFEEGLPQLKAARMLGITRQAFRTREDRLRREALKTLLLTFGPTASRMEAEKTKAINQLQSQLVNC